MPKITYTLHLLSNKSEKPFIISFSRRRVSWIIGAAAGIIAILILALLITLPRAWQYGKLKAENEQLIAERLKVAEILQDYNQIRLMDRYIRSVLGSDLTLPSDTASNVPALTPSPEARRFIEISFLENVPIYPPVDGYITRGFISDRVMTEENHFGVDVVAPEGTPIRASAAGVVIFANWTNYLGNTIIVYHSNGYFTLYGHTQRIIVNEHQYVNRGDVIAFLGNTGKSEGPHLHFEIWHERTPIDPQQMIYSYRQADISLKSEGGE